MSAPAAGALLAARCARWVGSLLSIALVVAGCDGLANSYLGPQEDCARSPLVATLHLDATDERYLWATDKVTGAIIEPRLRGDENLPVREGPPTLLLFNGNVIGRDGDGLISGCRDLVSGAYSIGRLDVVRVP